MVSQGQELFEFDDRILKVLGFPVCHIDSAPHSRIQKLSTPTGCEAIAHLKSDESSADASSGGLWLK